MSGVKASRASMMVRAKVRLCALLELVASRIALVGSAGTTDAGEVVDLVGLLLRNATGPAYAIVSTMLVGLVVVPREKSAAVKPASIRLQMSLTVAIAQQFVIRESNAFLESASAVELARPALADGHAAVVTACFCRPTGTTAEPAIVPVPSENTAKQATAMQAA